MAEVKVTPEQIAEFKERGYTVVRGLVKPHELAEAQKMFDDFMEQRLKVEGKDHGEHTPGLMNVTAFTLYHPIDTLGIFATLEARCRAVSAALWAGTGPELALDYDQLLRKLPGRPAAVFPPHQDILYWPKSASKAFDTRTTTCSVAINGADEANGCLWVLPGSHASQGFYAGCKSTLPGSRPDAGGVITLEILPEDEPRKAFLPLEPGDVSFHEEYIVHGSEGNGSDRCRDTLIFAYRAPDMIAFERSEGFRHSYNDGEAVLRKVREHIYP